MAKQWNLVLVCFNEECVIFLQVLCIASISFSPKICYDLWVCYNCKNIMLYKTCDRICTIRKEISGKGMNKHHSYIRQERLETFIHDKHWSMRKNEYHLFT